MQAVRAVGAAPDIQEACRVYKLTRQISDYGHAMVLDERWRWGREGISLRGIKMAHTSELNCLPVKYLKPLDTLGNLSKTSILTWCVPT